MTGTHVAETLASLRDWLKRDQALRRHKIEYRSGQSTPGTMGAIGDFITVIATSGAAGYTAREVSRVVIVWLKNQRSEVTVRIKGRVDIDISSSQAKDGSVESIISSIGAELDLEEDGKQENEV
ncbi:effector-associated constant component EACC1 [Saccharopolyspora pogona]|uniref:effector-associated constant component EACC1 n=1 Tax=Saccharopolyspora pogona TaxID=333966 RepID=UPI0016845B9D|nr:hypothetical protein [Saccharopolyspora pogona]